MSITNPFKPPETPPQCSGLSPQALRESWTAASRTFVVLAFIVLGTARFYSCLFDASFHLPAVLAALSVVALVICPATFATTLLDAHRRI